MTVCYALGITAANGVAWPVIRTLSLPHRDGPPDIDLDIESGRREEVIQYVYTRYGRHHGAGSKRHHLPLAVSGT